MDSVARPSLRQACSVLKQSKRSYATPNAYVPHQANSRIQPLPARPKPVLSTFCTGKPLYANAVVQLETAIKENEEALRRKHIWPLPPRLRLEAETGGWDKNDWKLMETKFATSLDRAQFKRVTGLLKDLALLRRVAQRSGQSEVVLNVNSIIEQYKQPREARQKSTKDKKSPIDEFGRTTTMGRRKESSAKVWLIKTKTPEDFSSRIQTALEIHARKVAEPESTEEPDYPALPTTEVLVNHLPIHQHFPRPSDRELVLRPLRLTGTLGYFNIFALASGGGTTGQAGATALAISRGIITFLPEMADILRRDGLLTRDPRMVERKKTGLAKARKRVGLDFPAYCVSRSELNIIVLLAVHMGQAIKPTGANCLFLPRPTRHLSFVYYTHVHTMYPIAPLYDHVTTSGFQAPRSMCIQAIQAMQGSIFRRNREFQHRFRPVRLGQRETRQPAWLSSSSVSCSI